MGAVVECGKMYVTGQLFRVIKLLVMDRHRCII